MCDIPNQSGALGSTEILDEHIFEALGSKSETLEQDYLKAYVPQPTTPFLHILQTQRSGVQGSALPPAWRPVQLALARVLSLPIEPGEKTCEPCVEIVDGLPSRYNPSLKKLLMVMYYHQVQELVGEMNSVGANTERQKEILGKLAEPLRRYTEAVEASGAHPFELDPIRRRLCNLFVVTTGKTRFEEQYLEPGRPAWFSEPLVVLLQSIRRSIRIRGLEAFAYEAIDIFARVLIATTGGLILIIPMIMMTFLTSPSARLVIICCFVVSFAALIGIFTKATDQGVLAATAAYTAVLAVFM